MENIFNQSNKDNINIELIDNGRDAEVYLKNLAKKKIEVSIDLVILDIKMLEIDGRELLTLVKTNEETKEIPVLVFSSSNKQQEINNSYMLRANCFLKKPTALKDYINTVLAVKNFWMNSEVVSLPSKF